MADLLRNYLAKFQQLEAERERLIKVLLDEIFKYSGVQLGAADLIWRGRALRLKTTPLKKGEILLKQKLILRALTDRLGPAAPAKLI